MNPMQMAMNILGNNNGNPMAQNVFGMIQRNDIKGIEQFGRNMAKERGVDLDAEFAKFKQQMNIR